MNHFQYVSLHELILNAIVASFIFNSALASVLLLEFLSLGLGLLVVKIHRGKRGGSTTFASLEIRAHGTVDVVGMGSGFILKVIQVGEQVGSVGFIRLFLRVNRSSGACQKLQRNDKG